MAWPTASAAETARAVSEAPRTASAGQYEQRPASAPAHVRQPILDRPSL